MGVDLDALRPDSAAIELRGLTRVFGKGERTVVALDEVSLVIRAGESVALLGENGAGKTTLTKILATLLLPTAGTALVHGLDVRRDANRVRELTNAVFGGDRGLYTMVTGRENLRYFGVINGVSPKALRAHADEVLERVGLREAADRRVETYSKGMRQRLHLAIGLLTTPRVLLLDEPTVGLDPNEARRLRQTVAEVQAKGTTVLMTSHNLLDVDELSERVVMIAHGKIVHDLSIAQFRALAETQAVVKATLAGHVDPKLPGSECRHDGLNTIVTVAVRSWSPSMLQTLSDSFRGLDIIGFDVRGARLEDAFSAASQGQS